MLKFNDIYSCWAECMAIHEQWGYTGSEQDRINLVLVFEKNSDSMQ